MASRTSVIWVTRDEDEDGPLCTALRARGLEVVLDPLVRTIIKSDGVEAASTLQREHWLVLTSPRSIELVSEMAVHRKPCVAVVGETSAHLARARGFRVKHVAPSRCAEGVWRYLSREHAGERICFMRSRKAAMPEGHFSHLDVIDLYDTAPRQAAADTPSRATLITLTSGAVVQACVDQFGELPLPAVSIGPKTTSRILHQRGRVAAEAEERTLQSLAQAAALVANAGKGTH